MVLHGGFDEAVEKRMRVVRLAEELRVELAGDEVGVRGQFDDLGEIALRTGARDEESFASMSSL